MTCCRLSVVRFIINFTCKHRWEYFPETCLHMVLILAPMLPKVHRGYFDWRYI